MVPTVRQPTQRLVTAEVITTTEAVAGRGTRHQDTVAAIILMVTTEHTIIPLQGTVEAIITMAIAHKVTRRPDMVVVGIITDVNSEVKPDVSLL